MKIIFFSFVCFICAVVCFEEGAATVEITPMHEVHSLDGHKFVMKIRGKRDLPLRVVAVDEEEVVAEEELDDDEVYDEADWARKKRNPSKLNIMPGFRPAAVDIGRRMKRTPARAGQRANFK